MRVLSCLALFLWGGGGFCLAQSADSQSVPWREPQVRYLLSDMSMGGNVSMYRDYAEREKDPDSLEAIRLWNAGARVLNTNEFERRWVTNQFGTDGKVMRVVFRGTQRTISGSEALLSTDGDYDDAAVRGILLGITLGQEMWRAEDPNSTEARRRWVAGVRVINAALFGIARGSNETRPAFVFKNSGKPADLSRVKLNTDLPYPETNVRYFMADIALGGSIEFYRKTAEAAHEMGCLEAVRRTEEGYRIVNLGEFERKKVDGKVLITRRGGGQRISGMELKLSSDEGL